MIDPANFPIDYLLSRKAELLRLLHLNRSNAELGLELCQIHDLLGEKTVLYLIDALPDREVAAFADHMRTCRGCRDRCDEVERELLLILGCRDVRLLRDSDEACPPHWALVEEAIGGGGNLPLEEHLLRCERCREELARVSSEHLVLAGIIGLSSAAAADAAAGEHEATGGAGGRVRAHVSGEAGAQVAASVASAEQPDSQPVDSPFTIAEFFRVGDSYMLVLQTRNRELDGARITLSALFPGEIGLQTSSETRILEGRALCKFENVPGEVRASELSIRKLKVRRPR